MDKKFVVDYSIAPTLPEGKSVYLNYGPQSDKSKRLFSFEQVMSVPIEPGAGLNPTLRKTAYCLHGEDCHIDLRMAQQMIAAINEKGDESTKQKMNGVLFFGTILKNEVRFVVPQAVYENGNCRLEYVNMDQTQPDGTRWAYIHIQGKIE